eukprot:CAMPEP_0195077654 /NCGR_PEP_ID=MMETSP0448-20130528/20036_1 /TAXON_ID=66468 /ORGANISM="Heterocapsa triquestra, Strain CCMP 448" /LENGTH=221 /DNA_ID=CAMNT_0040110319 /DNA_START=60 /DNA_END=725 /DNA_ORIENTATION=-
MPGPNVNLRGVMPGQELEHACAGKPLHRAVDAANAVSTEGSSEHRDHESLSKSCAIGGMDWFLIAMERIKITMHMLCTMVAKKAKPLLILSLGYLSPNMVKAKSIISSRGMCVKSLSRSIGSSVIQYSKIRDKNAPQNCPAREGRRSLHSLRPPMQAASVMLRFIVAPGAAMEHNAYATPDSRLKSIEWMGTVDPARGSETLPLHWPAMVQVMPMFGDGGP